MDDADGWETMTGLPEGRDSILRSLEGRHTFECLLYIGDYGPVLKTDVYRDVARGATMAGRIDTLVSLGLVEEHRGSGRKACYLSLTPKGRCVANIVRLMLDVAEGCPDRRGEDMDSVLEGLITEE